MAARPEDFLAKVMGEIDEEVRRRRASGDFPPSFERRLDSMFYRLAPVGAHGSHFAETLKLADRSAYVDIEVPVLSEKPGVSALKRVLRRLMAWYLNYVVQQITHFTSATMRVLHMVDERLVELESQVAADRPPELAQSDLPTAAADISYWLSPVCSRLEGTNGRVLHADCADGTMVCALAAVGLDAYGVDPRATLLDSAAKAGADVRCEGALDHLRAVGDLGLGGIVLSDCVDYLPLRAKRELAALAHAKVVQGGYAVILGTAPNHWERQGSVVETDLAPGRPLHPETWRHLLSQAGFESLEVLSGPASEELETVPGTDASAVALNSNLERLNQALFGPATYAVFGVRAAQTPGE